MNRLTRKTVCAAGVLLLTLCGTTAWAADLTVSAAASLTNAFRELAPDFEARNPGAKVLLNFASSDTLLAQIAQGAPADVYASADEATMDRAQARKLLAVGTRHDFAANGLVLIVAAGSTLKVQTLADLRQPAIRHIAIGNPASVPAGRYAQAALQAARLWSPLQPRFVPAQNVRQALDYVARAEADAGLVYATDAALMKDKVKVVLQVPTETPIRYPIAVIGASARPDLARRFVEFTLAPAGQAVLARHGFLQP